MAKIKERHKVNPFMDMFGISIQRKINKNLKVVDVDYINSHTGESVRTYIEEGLRKTYDGRRFIKLITTDESIKIMSDLSPSSHKLFYWIVKKLGYQEDWVYIHGAETQVELGYKSINSIYKAIEGLLEANLIAPKEGSAWSFYINPTVFYYGDIIPRYISHVAQKAISDNGYTDIQIKPSYSVVTTDRLPQEVIDRETYYQKDEEEMSRDMDIHIQTINSEPTIPNTNNIQYREGR
jgi:hypothetical protein